MVLQNDMGNTKIQDAKTGNIMGLSEGFIPVGMKEHGGIMYIASVNKEGKGEIGTIPSPVYTLKHKSIPDNWSRCLVSASGPVSTHSILNNQKLYPGDKFVVQLPLQRPVTSDFVYYSGSINPQTHSIQLLTQFNGSNIEKGLFNLKLYSVYGTGVTQLTKAMESPQGYVDTKLQYSNYWFIDDPSLSLTLDAKAMYKGNLFKSYPGNLPPGRLAVRAELEDIQLFRIIRTEQMPSAEQRFTYAPYIEEIQNADGSLSYNLQFIGFQYELDSHRFIGKIEVSLYDQKASKELQSWEFDKNDFKSITQASIVNGTTNTIQIRNVKDSTFHTVIESAKKTIATPVSPGAGAIPTSSYNPLFQYNIGKNLKNWYKIVVKYYDLYGGNIGTYNHSFNPYHILHSKDYYYNLRWEPSGSIRQQFDFGSTETTNPYKKSIDLTASNLSQGQFSSTLKSYSTVSSGSHAEIYQEVNGEYLPAVEHIVSVDTWQDATLNTGTISGHIPTIDLFYLYNDTLLTWSSKSYPVTYQINGELVSTTDSVVNVNVTGITLFSSDWECKTKESSLCYANGTALPDGSVGSQFEANGVFVYRVNASKDLNISKSFKLDPTNSLSFIQSTPVRDAYGDVNFEDSLASILPITISSIAEIGTSKIPVYLNHDFDRNSVYSIIPYFTLIGDKESEHNINLGFDRFGNKKKAWNVSTNYAASVAKKDKSDANSSFAKVQYIPKQGQITGQVLEAGTYIVNIQALNQSNKAYFSIDGIGNVSKFTHEGRIYFVPTIFHLPSPQLITFSWEDIDTFANIGIYQLTKPIIMNDGTIFGDDPSVNLLYYQDPSIKEGREPVLPVCATYHEDNIVCLDRPFNYYPGCKSPEYIERHFVQSSEDATIYSLNSFVYTYNPSTPIHTTIDSVEGVGNTLTYRIKHE